MIFGYVVIVTADDGTQSVVGPFMREERALAYADAISADGEVHAQATGLEEPPL